MKNRKNFICVCLIVAMLFSLVPREAWAESSNKIGACVAIEDDCAAVKDAGVVAEDDCAVVDEDDEESLKWQVGSIDTIDMQIFQNTAVEPKITVRNKIGDIISDFYYTVEYENNTGIGIGKVVVTGRWGYEGTVSKEFEIVKSKIPDVVKVNKTETDFGKVKLYFDPVKLGKRTVNYEVSCKKIGNAYADSYNFKAGSKWAMIGDLEYNKQYEFKIRAYYINECGDYMAGPWSDKISVYTNRYGNRSQKMIQADITNITLGKSSARVNVKKITLEDPKLKVYYRFAYRIKNYTAYDHENVDRLYETFYNLEKGVTYQFHVRYFYYSKLDGKPVYSDYSPAKNVRLKFDVNNVLKVARSWLGKNERDGSFKYIIDLYNRHRPLARGYKVKYTDEWCATAVSAMFIKAKAVSIPGGTECGVQRYIDIFKKRGVWEEDGRVKPRAGDIICYNWDDRSQKGGNNGWADHIGIVEKVRGNKITVIEGNYGRRVARRTIPVGWGYIRGYAKLTYPTSSKVW